MSKTKGQLYSSIAFLAFGVFLWITIPMYVIVESGKFGPQTFPQFISICMMLLSIVQIIATLRQMKREKLDNRTPETIAFNLSNEMRVLLVMLITVAYCALFDAIGFLAATSVYVTVLLYFFEVRRWALYLLSYGTIFLLYLLFAKLMHVSL